jgi:tetratricopeptide (TPR) repeat protein
LVRKLAQSYRSTKRVDEAVSKLEEIVKVGTAQLGPGSDTLLSMYELATTYRVAGRHAEALSLYEAALQRNPRRAVELAIKAVELEPDSASQWHILGWVQYRAGDWQASIDAMEKSDRLAEDPKGGDARQWFCQAMAHQRMGHDVEARQCRSSRTTRSAAATRVAASISFLVGDGACLNHRGHPRTRW